MTATRMMLMGTVLLTALAAFGCKKKPAAPPVEATNSVVVISNAPVATAPPAPSRTHDLGVVLLTNRCETSLQLGGGKTCTITPQVIDAKHLQLTLALESRMADGKPRGLNIMKVTSQPGQQFEVDFGGMDITLTPQLVEP